MSTALSLYQTTKKFNNAAFTHNNKHSQSDSKFKKNSHSTNKSSFLKNTGATLAGLATYGVINYGVQKPLLGLINKPFLKQSEKINLSLENADEIAKDILEKKGLSSEVKLYFVDKNNIENIKNEIDLGKSLKSFVRNSKKLTLDQKLSIKDIYSGSLNKVFNKVIEHENKKIRLILDMIYQAKNAFYQPFAKLVAAPAKKPFLIIHELGHTLSLIPAGLIKIASKAYSHILIPPLVLAAGLLHNKKDKEDKSFVEKTADFVKDNSGKLTFAAFAPLLIEEAKASIKGVKAAKEHELFKPHAKGVKKVFALAYLTYLASALITSTAVMSAGKVKDRFKAGA